jgi:type VI secretion system (T6SS) effector TldE1-like protein
MDYRTTSRAGRISSRGTSSSGKAVFALAALAVMSGLGAWMADDVSNWLRKPNNTNGARLSSFDDRFGSGAARNGPSIRYPSRPVTRAGRADFDAEFGHIESQLADLSPDPQAGPASSSAEPAVPLPRSRPAEANVALKIDPPPARPDDRTMFQKLADLVPLRFTLASLTPNDGLFNERPNLGKLGYDDVTAVYDISARVVYMPNGARLEAHSGLGGLMDDPSHVAERNVGATPPNVYDLKPRERLFHGVAALRMTPVGENDTLGRSGLLVHSYMLGPNGDSNGCVSIKDYDKFLQAYRNGEVKRLVVVPSLKEGLTASRRATSPS